MMNVVERRELYPILLHNAVRDYRPNVSRMTMHKFEYIISWNTIMPVADTEKYRLCKTTDKPMFNTFSRP